MDKLIRDLSDEELVAEYHYWDDKIRNATAWGAALGAADGFRRSCKQQMDLRGLAPHSNRGGSPPNSLTNNE